MAYWLKTCVRLFEKSSHCLDMTRALNKAHVLVSLIVASASCQPLHASELLGSDVAKFCLQAVDYSGCIKTLIQYQPLPQGLTEKSYDIVGEPIINGWDYIEDPANRSATYINPKTVTKLKVRGIYGRYFRFTYIQRKYVPPIPAREGYYGEMIPAETICEWKKDKQVCSERPAVQPWIPAIAAKPATFLEEYSDSVVDCKDETAKWSKSNRRWRPAKAYFVINAISKYCSNVDSLPASKDMSFSSGSPTFEDYKYINSLKSGEKL